MIIFWKLIQSPVVKQFCFIEIVEGYEHFANWLACVRSHAKINPGQNLSSFCKLKWIESNFQLSTSKGPLPISFALKQDLTLSLLKVIKANVLPSNSTHRYEVHKGEHRILYFAQTITDVAISSHDITQHLLILVKGKSKYHLCHRQCCCVYKRDCLSFASNLAHLLCLTFNLR